MRYVISVHGNKPSGASFSNARKPGMPRAVRKPALIATVHRQLLRNPRLQMAEIAERLGFSDPAAFSRAFRKWSGLPPSEWRTAQLGAA